MLSIENSSDPSSSNSNKDLDLIDVGHEVQAQPSNFSIRGYVFNSRSKGIRSNWPFREQLLQLCLDIGVNEILPPFESPSLVRAQYSIKNQTSLNVGEPGKDINELESCSTLDSLVVLSSNKATQNEVVETNHEEQLKNKSKLLESNLIKVSNIMASKACPVCKSFTSSSNTTLNAHIDQCLSSDKSNMTREETELILVPKVKPRKKRLMVDIYKTAPHCTLEDLDRRNGTNWAANPAFTAPANDANAANDANDHARLETKRTKLVPLDKAREGNVGDIYVDSNGTKLLILSKCNDSSPMGLRKNLKMKKHGKCLNTIKKISQPSSPKFMEDTILRRKSSLVRAFQGEDTATTSTKEQHIDEAYKEREKSNHVKNSEPLKLGHWVCSKRSDLSRKISNKKKNEGSKKMIDTPTQKLLSRPQQNSDHSHIEKSHTLNHPNSLKSANSPKFKGMKAICNTLKELDSEKTCSSRPTKLNSKLPSFESMASKKSSLSRTLVDKREIVMGKKFKKQRSILGCSSRRVGEIYSNVSRRSQDSTDNFGLSKIHSSNITKEQEKEMHCTDATIKEMESITRVETRAELSTYNEAAQCEDAFSYEVGNQDIQVPTDQAERISHHEEFQNDTSSFQDPSHCLTSDEEMGAENTQENSSTTSIRNISSGQDHKLFIDMESSVSELSTTSTMSPPSPVMDDKLNEYVAKKDNKVKFSPEVREPSCSCSEGLSLESQFLSYPKMVMDSNLFVKPPMFSPVNPIYDSHTENISQNQSTSNPVLRLMGKDLVVSKQESMQLPTRHCDTESNFISFGIPNNTGYINYNNHYQYCPIQATHNYQIPLHPNQMLPKPIMPQFQAGEVVAIDANCHSETRGNFTTLPPQTFHNSNVIAPQRVFSCYPSQNRYASKVFTTSQRETTEGTYIFPSPASLYFASTLR